MRQQQKNQIGGVPLWRSELRIQHCPRSNLGDCCAEGLIPGLGNFECHGQSQKQTSKQKPINSPELTSGQEKKIFANNNKKPPPYPASFTNEFYQTLKKGHQLYTTNFSRKLEGEIYSNSFYEAIYLITKPENNYVIITLQKPS